MSGGRRLLVGLGNDLRGDDAAGLLVAREARRLLAGAGGAIEVLELAGEPVGLLDAWAGAERVVLADAVASGAAPGALHRLDAAAAPLPAAFATASTHALGLAEAIELGRALGRLPRRLTVLGIEAERLATGAEPSPAVLAAVAVAAARALTELGAVGFH
ncbi:MAG: hydrogenase maturation protease [Solirubrobacterales bacterium]